MTRVPPGVAPRDVQMDFLCAFAVLNPLVVQASYFFGGPATPWGLSIPQIFQGTAFLVGFAIVLRSRWTPTAHTARMGRVLVLVSMGTAVFLGKSLLESSGLSSVMAFRGDFVFYFKMVFWISSWYLIAIVVRNESDAFRLLRSVALGALLAATIAVICFVTGAGTIAVYAREGVRASIGASGVSVKQTVPYLASCAFVVMYLGRRGPWVAGLMAALILFTATLVSYDRAVQVGMIAAGLWLLAWRFLISARRRVSSNEWKFIAGGLVVVALFASLGFDSLRTRWTGDLEKNRPGSGRLEFYQAAWESFSEASVPDVMLGIGYSGIRRTMNEQCGMSIHTHSDLFDLLLGGGLFGLAIYAALFWSLGMYLRGVQLQSEECALMGAVGAVYVVMSLITGLLEATHAMFCLGVIAHCCHVLAKPALTSRHSLSEESVNLAK